MSHLNWHGRGQLSRGGAVIRALAFHKCYLGLNPGPHVISRFLVLSYPECFFLGSQVPLPPKNQHSKSQINVKHFPDLHVIVSLAG